MKIHLITITDSLINRTKELNKGFKEFTTSEKAYIFAQVLWVFSLVIWITISPILVNMLTGDASLMGVNRAVYLWTIAGCSFFSGEVLKAFSARNVLIKTSILRALIFGTVAILIFAGTLSFTQLLVIVAINAVIISHSHLLDLDTGGINKIFSSAKKKEKALYLYMLIEYTAFLILPIILSIIVDFLEVRIGIGFGVSMAYALICGLMFLSSYIYFKYLPLLDETKKKERQTKRKSLSLQVFFDTHKRLWNTAKIVWKNSLLLLRFCMLILEQFIDDALLLIVLPTFALNILNAGIIGNGLLLASWNAGGLLAAFTMLSNAEILQKKYGLYPFLLGLGIAAACAFIPSLIFWMAPAIWTAVPAVILMKFLYEPLRYRMNSMLQLEIASNAEAKPEESNIFSLLNIIENTCAGAGGLFFVWIFHNSVAGAYLHNLLGEGAAMKMVTLILLGDAIITLLALKWLKTHVYHTYYSSQGVENDNLTELNKNLNLMGLSPYQTDIVYAETTANRPTTALLALPTLHKLAIIREGGRQSPGDIHLVLDPAWILQELQPDNTNRLYLKKGLYFDREGDLVLAEYKRLRPLHYFANFCTPGTFTAMNGVPLESKLDIPMSSSYELENLIKEKLLTRIWLAESGISSPATLAFLMPSHFIIDEIAQYYSKAKAYKILVMAFPSNARLQRRSEITMTIKDFFQDIQTQHWVVQPSGARFPAQYGIKFFSSHQIAEIVDYVLQLSEDTLMTSQGAILIEQRINPPPLYIRIGEEDQSGRYGVTDTKVPIHILSSAEIPHGADSDKKDWVLHLLIARTPWNSDMITSIIASVYTRETPLTLQAAVVPFEDVLSALQLQHSLLTTEEERWIFLRELNALADRTLKAIENKIQEFPITPDHPVQTEIDYLGLDVMVETVKGMLVPKIIAVNDHDVGKQQQFDEVYPLQAGEHSRAWVATMLSRARRNVFKGKRLVLVGSDNPANKFFFDKAKEWGLHIILVDQLNSWAKDLVTEYIPVDLRNQIQAHQLAYNGLQRSIHSYGPLDGITSFSEEGIILTAELARDLKLPYHSVEAARTLGNKIKTRKTLKAANLPAPLFFSVFNQHTLDQALHQITRIQHATGVSTSMFLKPVFGKGSQFSVKVQNAEETREAYAKISKEILQSENIICEQESAFILEECLDGMEWDVDLVIQAGKVQYTSITDNWAMSESYFLGDSLPGSRLTSEMQQACIQLAINAVTAIGLTDGVIHVKGKYTPKKGPQILAVNGRPPGPYIVKWHMDVWGVDLVELQYAIALRIPISVYKSTIPRTYLEGISFP